LVGGAREEAGLSRYMGEAQALSCGESLRKRDCSTPSPNPANKNQSEVLIYFSIQSIILYKY